MNKKKIMSQITRSNTHITYTFKNYMLFHIHKKTNTKSCIDNTQIYTFRNDMQMKDEDASEP